MFTEMMCSLGLVPRPTLFSVPFVLRMIHRSRRAGKKAKQKTKHRSIHHVN